MDQFFYIFILLVLTSCSSLPKKFRGNDLVRWENENIYYYFDDSGEGFSLYLVKELATTPGNMILSNKESALISCKKEFIELSKKFNKKRKIIKQPEVVVYNSYCEASNFDSKSLE